MSQGTLIGIDQLVLGSITSCDLLDLNGNVVIPTGTSITNYLIESLKLSGAVALVPKRADYASHHVTFRQPTLDVISSRIYEMQRRSGINTPLTSATSDLARKVVADTFRDLAHGGLPDLDSLNMVIDRILHDTELLATPPIPSPHHESDTALEMVVDSSVDMAVLLSWHLKRDGQPENLVRAGALGGIVHDCGLAQIDPDILSCTEPLSQPALMEIRRHPYLGLRSVSPLNDILPQETRDIILLHHENENGTGYPLKRSGEKLSGIVKIARILDSYIALVSPRPHRQRHNPHQAVEILMRGSGKQYNGEVLKNFIGRTGRYPLGSAVVLNSNEVGVVVGIGKGGPFKPVVDIYYSNQQKFSQTPQRVDLGRDSIKYIRQVMR